MSPPSSSSALQGALLAFQGGQSPNPRTGTHLTPGSSSAPSRDPSPRRLPTNGTGTSRARPHVSPSRSDVSAVGGAVARGVSNSRAAESLIAANVAAGRSPARAISPVRTEAADDESSSFRGTTSLISMFEGTDGGGSESSAREAIRTARTPTGRGRGGDLGGDPVKSDSLSVPRPRARTPVGTSYEEPAGKPTTPSRKPQLKPKPTVDAALLAARQVAATQSAGTKEAPAAPQPTRGTRPPTPPKPRGNGMKTVSPAPSASTVARRGRSVEPETELARTDTVSSEDTFVSASSVQSPPQSPSRTSSTPVKPSSTSPVRRPVPPPRRTPGAGQNQATLSQTTALSNAILAGSLASARLTPSNTGDATAKPQPSPRILATLRTGDGEKHHKHEEEKRHRHGHGLRHRHRHRHGHKKREARISEPQRKRYEALWASNRGLLVDEHLASGAAAPGDERANYVVNVVVRELWRRSRLPDDELEEVWALVDVEGRGVLGRREFVVGTWLVDQRLRGRKIPARVGEGVWDSASGVVVRR